MAKANKLRTCERRAGGDCSPLGGGLEKAALDCYSRGPRKQPAPARDGRPILRAAEHRAGGGPRGAPKKRPWTAIQGGGGRDSGPRPGDARPILWAAEHRAGGGLRGAQKKRPWTAIQLSENGASPAISVSELTKNRSNWM